MKNVFDVASITPVTSLDVGGRPTAGLCLLTSERGTSIYRSHFKAQSQLVCEASRKFYLNKPGSQGHWGRVPEVKEGSAGQCLALRGESSKVLN